MKKVILITHVNFWRGGAGDAERINGLVKYLCLYTELTVVFGGSFESYDSHVLENQVLKYNLIRINEGKIVPSDYSEKTIFFSNLISNIFNQENYDTCIIEVLDLAFLLKAIPIGVKKILDTHDIISEKNESFKNINYLSNLLYPINQKEEYKIFSKFDLVLAIKESDYIKISNNIGYDKTLLVPHSVNYAKQKLNLIVKNISFVASEYPPNVFAITWFINEVWPMLIRNKSDLYLNIYGNIIRRLKINNIDRINLTGWVSDINEIYRNSDIIVNPVKVGAGIKIKNIEALGHGIPLITTKHASEGIYSLDDQVFLIANTPKQFYNKILFLINHYDARIQLGSQAYNFVSNIFSPEKCYGKLLNYVNQ